MTDDEAKPWVDSAGQFSAYVHHDGDICIENDDLDYDMGFTPSDWDSLCDYIAVQRALRLC